MFYASNFNQVNVFYAPTDGESHKHKHETDS